MKSCKYLGSCGILADGNGASMPKMRSLFRERYCLNNAGQCARFRIAEAVGFAQVPEFMLPSQIEWADQIINEQKSAVVSRTSSSKSTP